jgi:hypothetical protein
MSILIASLKKRILEKEEMLKLKVEAVKSGILPEEQKIKHIENYQNNFNIFKSSIDKLIEQIHKKKN